MNETMGAYGLWHVTTEGDCEGRSTKDLGTHEGFLDEIAFSLAGAVEYGLQFSRVQTDTYKVRPPKTEVNVSLDIGTGTWDLGPNERAAFFKKMLEGRPVSIGRSDFYAAVTLIAGRDPAEQERLRKEAARRLALSKLSAEDREALDLK